MSRLGKKPVEIPAGVKVTVAPSLVTVQGSKGTLKVAVAPGVQVRWGEGEKSLVVSIDGADPRDRHLRAMWGTTRSHLQNAMVGVTKGYEETMEVVGVGWGAVVQGSQLKLSIGFANSVMMSIPAGLKVTADKTLVKIEGPDKQQVGQFASSMRAKRKPEPYNGKGIKYKDEVIRQKEGKKFGA